MLRGKNTQSKTKHINVDIMKYSRAVSSGTVKVFYLYLENVCSNKALNLREYRDQPWFSVFKHSMDHEEGV